MELKYFPFQTVEWKEIEAEAHAGITGTASWKTFNMGNVRIRMVEYSPSYFADHWCNKAISFTALAAK